MVAARSGGLAGEAYVPCPVCGGRIHPIAGRCKHCKSDLVALRAGTGIPTATAAAPASIPIAVIAGPVAAPIAAPVAQYAPLNAAAFAPSSPTAMPIATASPGGLAPAAPGLLAPAAVVPGALGSRWTQRWAQRWPILVVILAAAAIVVSIVLLVMPEQAASAERRHGAPPPSPDNMNTNPIPQAQDPWGMAPQIPDRPSLDDPDDDPDDDDVDPDDADLWAPRPGAGRGGRTTGATVAAPPPDEFVATLGVTLCHRLQSCAPSGDAIDCDQFGTMLGSSVLPGLACGRYDRSKASSCLTSISRFPCASGGTLDPYQMKALVTGLPDCIDACRP